MNTQNPSPAKQPSPQNSNHKPHKDHSIHTLNKVKMKPLLPYLWTNLEQILVDMPCDFKADSQKRYRNGFLVITYGAVYLFKNKFLVAPPPTFCLTLLDCRIVTCNEKASTITLLYADLLVTIKVKEAVKIINIMAKIVSESTYGLRQYLILPRFQIEKNTNVTADVLVGTENTKKPKTKGHNDVANPTTSDNSISDNAPSKQPKEKSEEIKPVLNDPNSPPPKSDNGNENEIENEPKPQQQPRRVRFGIPHDPYSRSTQVPLVNTSSYFYCGPDEHDEDFDNPDCERIHLSKLCTQRPRHALLNRCLFLAHFYDKYGRHLDEGCYYLAKYDREPIDTLTIGPHFFPNIFSLSFGHAIGWETNLKKVMFYHFKPMDFGHLLESIMINSITIEQICFIDYKYSDKPLSEIKKDVYKQARKRNMRYIKYKSNRNAEEESDDEYEEDSDESDESSSDDGAPRKPRDYFDHYTNRNNQLHPKSKFPIYVPDFSFYKVKSTNVKSFWFHECDYPVITAFFEALEDYICPIEEFEITSCKFNPTQLGQIFKDMANLECFVNLKTFAFLKNDVQMFPIDSFQQYISIASSLETIEISDCQLDGSQLFASLCQAHSPVKSVKMTNLPFHSLQNMSTLTLPPALIQAVFSQCFFSPQAFKDMLLIFTNKKTNQVISNCDKVTTELANSDSPVMLSFANITMKHEGYEVFGQLVGYDLAPNICEFDWSDNKIPANCINSFFGFLETQTKMRILVLNNIKLEKQSFFFRRLLKYIMKQKLPGLDMRAKLFRKYGVPFYESLKKATFLRKLGVVIRNGSDEVMAKFNELIRMLPMLTELKADGFLPHTSESLINLWTTIINHPTLCAHDMPRVDILYLSKKHQIKITDNEFMSKLKAAKESRKTPSTMQQRTDFVLQQIRTRNVNLQNNNSIITAESDFFIASCSTPWIDSTPYSRLETLESDANLHRNDLVQPLIDSHGEHNQPPNNEPTLLNIGEENNEYEIYNMQCIPADIENSGIAPTPMPTYLPDSQMKDETFKLAPTEFPPLDENEKIEQDAFKQADDAKADEFVIDDGRKVDDEEFDDQSLEVDDESDDENDNSENNEVIDV